MPLPPDQVNLSRSLPAKPAALVLDGRRVRLEPLNLQRDNAPLHKVSCGDSFELGGKTQATYDADDLIWRYMAAGPFATSCKLAAFLNPQIEAANGLCFCVYSKELQSQVGVVNYMNNFPEHLKIELGNIWYSPIVQRTGVNLEATYLLLNHAFELGYRRVEWKCDSLNERSRRAALAMGFKFEGIQESHFIIKGRNRDTAWYRILADEWPTVMARLNSLLERDQAVIDR
jgi:RimJ/RimL family protein N-acetyltransferase